MGLRPERLAEIKESVGTEGSCTHQCHSTYDGNYSGGNFPICNGYLNMMEKTGELNGILGFAKRAGLYGPEHIQSADLVFDSWDQMIEAHSDVGYHNFENKDGMKV